MTQLFEQLKIKDLSIEERIVLVGEIWDSIAAEEKLTELTEEQKTELDRRLESYRRNPDESVTWESVKSRLLYGK